MQKALLTATSSAPILACMDRFARYMADASRRRSKAETAVALLIGAAGSALVAFAIWG